MNTCPNCGRTANENFCCDCGTRMMPPAPQPTAKPRKKGKAGAIARLIVSALVVIGTIFGAVTALFSDYTTGIGDAIVGLMSVLGTGCFTGVVILALWRWLCFILPKSFGWANGFWRSWHALTFFGLYIKGAIWLIILIFPVSVMTSLLSSACFALVGLFLNVGLNFFTGLIYLAVCGGAMALLVLLDYCKVKELSAKAVLKDLLTSKKASRAN